MKPALEDDASDATVKIEAHYEARMRGHMPM
jgi:hypothetical protein